MQSLEINRFRKVIVESRLQTAIDVLRHSIPSEGYGRRVADFPGFLNEVQACSIRKPDITEDQIIGRVVGRAAI